MFYVRGAKMLNMKKENGQSLVEFALVLPILLILVFGIIDFGMLFSAKNQLEMTSFAAARTISLGNTVPTPPPGITVIPMSVPTGYTVGQQVTVTASSTYTGITPIFKVFFGSNDVELTSNIKVVIEQLP